MLVRLGGFMTEIKIPKEAIEWALGPAESYEELMKMIEVKKCQQ